MYKYLLFDLDDTILDFEKAERIAVKKTLKELGVSPKDAYVRLYHEINEAGWAKCERGEMAKNEHFSSRFDEFFNEIGLDKEGKIGEDLYENHLKEGVYLMPGAKRVLRKLHKDYTLVLVSNGVSATQKTRLANAKIKEYFKGIFVSDKMGVSKPDKSFFDKVLRAMRIRNKESCLIIGNGITSDILGGKNSGIDTCWYNYRDEAYDNKIKPTYVIHDLQELFTLL